MLRLTIETYNYDDQSWTTAYPAVFDDHAEAMQILEGLCRDTEFVIHRVKGSPEPEQAHAVVKGHLFHGRFEKMRGFVDWHSKH